MGSLSNLYISQSYQGLLTFSTNSGSTSTLTEISDGNGEGLGLYLNNSGTASLDGDLTVGGDFIVSGTFDIEGKVTVNDNVRVNGNLEVSGSTRLTGSLNVSNSITASNAFITNDLSVSGTLFANKVVTLIESSSIIYSSGSNILGDEITDTQTLIGSVIMSGSSQLTGSMGITDNLNVLGNISSSTISGIGNVTTYSQSVDSRLDIVEATASLYVPFSQSVDSRLDNIQDFTASANISLSNLNATTASLNSSVAQLNVATQSLYSFTQSAQISINNLNLYTASFINNYVTNTTFNSFTSSTNGRLNNIEVTTASLNSSVTQLNVSSASQQISINALNSVSASLATTGSNTFRGNEIFSGSVRGVVIPLTITSQTASMDCSLGNFFTLNLANGVDTKLIPTNINPGETISLLVTQNASSAGSLSYQNIKFQVNAAYTSSVTLSSQDMLTFISYDTNNLYGAYIKNLA